MAHAHKHAVVHLWWCTRKSNCWCEFWWLALIGALSFIILAIQVPASFWYESTALAADSHHVGLDGSTVLLAMALFAAVKYGWDSTRLRDFGFWTSLLLLGISAVLMGHEAYLRFAQEQNVQGYELAAVSAVGGSLNAVQIWLISKTIDTCHDHRDIRDTFFAHFWLDMLNNVAISIGGIVIEWTGWRYIDLILTVLIILRIVWMVYGLIKNPSNRGKPHSH